MGQGRAPGLGVGWPRESCGCRDLCAGERPWAGVREEREAGASGLATQEEPWVPCGALTGGAGWWELWGTPQG